MAYTIKNTDGTTLVLLADGRIDSESTSLTLVGKNYASYGEIWNNNLIKLMGHFAKSTAPLNPIKGQLWYDTDSGKLNVFDEEFKPINGAIVEDFEPENLSIGDFWFDSFNEQLKIKTESGVQVVGPDFPSSAQSGWLLPPNPIRDTSNNIQQVVLLRNYGETVGFLSNAAFFIQSTATNAYITATTTATVEGLTLLGDLQVTGTLSPQSIEYPDKVSSVELAYGGSLIALDNLAVAIENYRPKIATVSGTVTVAYRGWYHRLGQGMAPTEDDSLSLTTSGEYVVPVDKPFNTVGDTCELFLTDITDPPNFKTYRVTYQYLGGSFTNEQCSLTIERLL